MQAMVCWVFMVPVVALAADTTLALLGSSTAAGVGASSPPFSWAGLLGSWQEQSGNGRLLNLAEPGALTSSGLCNKDRRPSGGLARQSKNSVESALALGARRIILAYPSNDLVAGWPAKRTLDNIASMAACARNAGAVVAVMSSLPRAQLTPAQIVTMGEINQALRQHFGTCFIDVHQALSDVRSNEARAEYAAGDGVHFNDQGHRILYAHVRAFVESARCL